MLAAGEVALNHGNMSKNTADRMASAVRSPQHHGKIKLQTPENANRFGLLQRLCVGFTKQAGLSQNSSVLAAMAPRACLLIPGSVQHGRCYVKSTQPVRTVRNDFHLLRVVARSCPGAHLDSC